MTSATGRSPERQARGFTLLELVAVLIVIATVLAIAAPSLRSFSEGRRTADAAAQLLCLTHYARSQAVAQACVYRLNIDVEQGVYWLTLERAGAFVELGTEQGDVFRLPDGVSVAVELPGAVEAQSYVQFYADGRSDVAVIELTGRGGEVLWVTCGSPSERYRIVSPSEGEPS